MKKIIMAIMIAAIGATSAMAREPNPNGDTGGFMERPNLERVKDHFTPEEFKYAKDYNDELFTKLSVGAVNFVGFLVAKYENKWIEDVVTRNNVKDSFNVIDQGYNVYTLNATHSSDTVFKLTNNQNTGTKTHTFGGKSGIYTMRCQDNGYGLICGVNPGWLAEMDLHTDLTQQQMLNQIKKEVQSDHEGRPVVLVNQT